MCGLLVNSVGQLISLRICLGWLLGYYVYVICIALLVFGFGCYCVCSIPVYVVSVLCVLRLDWFISFVVVTGLFSLRLVVVDG